MSMTTQDVTWLSSLLQVALMLRLGEHGHAEDSHPGLTERADADLAKLDAYTLGVVEGLLSAEDSMSGLFPLLVYLLEVGEHGISDTALRATEQCLSQATHPDFSSYKHVGHDTASSVLAGEHIEPGAYARLLLRETQLN